MKTLLLSLLIFIALTSYSQTVIEYDRMEDASSNYLSAGWWGGSTTSGWFTNASVSTNTSAAIYGSGSGTSAYEGDWYVLPNIILDPTHQYQLKFRLASYTFSNSTASTRGVDVGDYVDVQLSTNGGISYTSELRITGNNNARWPYESTGTIFHYADGTYNSSNAPIGDVYRAPAGQTATGPSTIYLDLPANTSQVAIDIYCRVNANGEEWWIDDIELWDITPEALPVEMISFEGKNTEQGNVLIWKTASEHNSSYYLIERSTTGEFTENSVIAEKSAAGNSVETLTYAFVDNSFTSAINYYQITQVDVDGKFKIYGPIAIDNSVFDKRRIKLINSLGQEVFEVTTSGIYIEVYDDGSIKKIWR